MDNWSGQQQQLYRQRQEEQAALRRVQAVEHAVRLRQQLEQQQQQQAEAQCIRLAQIEKERELKAAQRATAMRRVASGLSVLDAERSARQKEARERLRQWQESIQTTWKSKDGLIFASPLEADFWDAWCETYPSVHLERQYNIGRYRVDFAHLASHTVIELDGHKWHSTRAALRNREERDHALEDIGWRVLHFRGDQVIEDLEGCVGYTYQRIMKV